LACQIIQTCHRQEFSRSIASAAIISWFAAQQSTNPLQLPPPPSILADFEHFFFFSVWDLGIVKQNEISPLTPTKREIFLLFRRL
jgi:hypothetical protein